MTLMMPLLLPSLGEVIVMAFIIAVFAAAWRWASRTMGAVAETDALRPSQDPLVEALRELRRGIDRIDGRMDMLEVMVKDVKNRMDTAESAEPVGGSR